MPTVQLRFPGGRYHATPWGHHVNEGQIEWPPSPWRLLRALIATGYATQGWTEIPAEGRRLFERLAEVLPTYQLPLASAAHSRHYMPTGELSKGSEKTTLVFDTWANVSNGELLVRWNCDLDPDSTELLVRLVESLGYLGRSESWVEARMASNNLSFRSEQSAYPHCDNEYPGPEWEQIPLMAPVAADVFAEWRKQRTAAALSDLPLPEGKKKPTQALLKKRAAAEVPFPRDLLDCLQKDTVWWKKLHNWSQPPGSRKVLYWRKADSLVVSVPRISSQPTGHCVEAMLLALSTPNRNSSALPHVSRTLPQAELFHRAIVGRAGNGRRVSCSELTGKDEQGEPMRNGHQHAHILPLDLDDDQYLDHILVHAPMELGPLAQEAIRSLKQTWTKGGKDDLQVSLIGRGNLHELRMLGGKLTAGIERLLGPVEKTTSWVSATPFVPPRFLKRQGKNSLEGQIAAELESRNLPAATRIEVLRAEQDDSARAMRHFVRVRKHKGAAPPQDVGFALRIDLSEPVTGPITLGYAAHFGLGRFEASNQP